MAAAAPHAIEEKQGGEEEEEEEGEGTPRKLSTLSPEEIDFAAEPHLEQGRYLNGEFTVYQLEELQRVLRRDAPQRKYWKIPHHLRTVNHWGQRKLLLSEIEFLTEHLLAQQHGEEDQKVVVLYVGAAPGTHLPCLARLFPQVKRFLLYDPAEFNVVPSERIILHQRFFTKEVAVQLREQLMEKGETPLFISDVRTVDPRVMTEEEVEASVTCDMDMQMEWVEVLRPKASMLKFRLPWREGHYRYLKGELYLPVWGPQTTTESRLVVRDVLEYTHYDNLQYCDQMFYFNTATRVSYYQHGLVTHQQQPQDQEVVAGLDHCYDCAAEVLILKRYLEKHCSSSFERHYETDTSEHRIEEEEEEEMKKKEFLHARIADLSNQISREISQKGYRTLQTRLDTTTRKSWFKARKYDVQGQRVIDLGWLPPCTPSTTDLPPILHSLPSSSSPSSPSAFTHKRKRADQLPAAADESDAKDQVAVCRSSTSSKSSPHPQQLRRRRNRRRRRQARLQQQHNTHQK